VQEFALITESLDVAVVDPGLLQFKGEIGAANDDLLSPKSTVSETTASDRILIRFLLREPVARLDSAKRERPRNPKHVRLQYWNRYW
jgi:hypothetical protein